MGMVNIHSVVSLEGEYQNIEKKYEKHAEQGTNPHLDKSKNK